MQVHALFPESQRVIPILHDLWNWVSIDVNRRLWIARSGIRQNFGKCVSSSSLNETFPLHLQSDGLSEHNL